MYKLSLSSIIVKSSTLFKTTNLSDFNSVLQDNKFKFIETTINCVHSGKLPELNKVQKRILDSLYYSKFSSKEDFNRLFTEIRSNMFTDDRISRDGNFTQDQANERYIGWLNDEISNKSSEIFKLIYKNDEVGFFVLRKKDTKTVYAVLGGIYSKYRAYGFGFCMNYMETVEGKKQGFTRIETSFSTNNRASTSMHFALDYQLNEMHNVFVKHNN